MSGLLYIYRDLVQVYKYVRVVVHIQGFSIGKHVRVVVYIQGFSTGKHVRVVVYILYTGI